MKVCTPPGRERFAEYIATSACFSNTSAEISGSSAAATASPTLGLISRSCPSMRNGSSKACTTRCAISRACSACLPSAPRTRHLQAGRPCRRSAHTPRSRSATRIEQCIPGGMSEAVVDEFEVVEIQRQHRHRLVVALVQLHRMSQAVVEQHPVRQPGQRIAQGLIGDRVQSRRFSPTTMSWRISTAPISRHDDMSSGAIPGARMTAGAHTAAAITTGRYGNHIDACEGEQRGRRVRCRRDARDQRRNTDHQQSRGPAQVDEACACCRRRGRSGTRRRCPTAPSTRSPPSSARSVSRCRVLALASTDHRDRDDHHIRHRICHRQPDCEPARAARVVDTSKTSTQATSNSAPATISPSSTNRVREWPE